VSLDHAPQSGEGSSPDLLRRFAPRSGGVVTGGPPELGPARFNLVGREPLPPALIDFPEIRFDDDVEPVGRGNGRGGVQSSSEVARIDGDEVIPGKLGGGVVRLGPAVVVELYVGVALSPLCSVPLGCPVPDQQNGGDVSPPF
jgi:hypothetical protein